MAGSTYKRVMLEVDSVKFYPLEVKYVCSRNSNQVGRRIGESLQARLYFWVDPHDISRLSQAHLIELWKMATETKDPLHKISATWFLEDGDKVLCNMEFKGWLSVFQFSNPAVSGVPGTGGVAGDSDAAMGSQVAYNNMCYGELVVTLDESNVQAHKLTK